MSTPSSSSQSCGCGGCHTPAPSPSSAAPELPWWRRPPGLLAGCGLLLALGLALSWAVPQTAPWALLPALLTGGAPVARRAARGLAAGRPFSMEMLMSVAMLGALVIGAWDEAAMVVFLFLLGEALEGVAARKARAGIAALAALLPAKALRRQGGHWVEVDSARIRVGDHLLLRPGERLAVDGVVAEGEGGVDEAVVSGESRAVPRKPGDALSAGMLSVDGVLVVRATSDIGDNTVTRIARLVEQAQAAKAPFARFVDRFARWYTPLVVAAAALVAVLPPLFAGQDWAVWFYRALALMLIGCPCALVISTPAALAAALAAGARQGVLFKGGDVVERLSKADVVALDKTGTLTLGRPVVTDMVVLADADHGPGIAAALCRGSSHPVAQAILAQVEGCPPQAVADAHAVPGAGIGGTWNGRAVFLGAGDDVAVAADFVAQGKTVSVLTVDGRPLLVFALGDQIRSDAAAAIAHLRRLGLRLFMLSGDHQAAARAVADALGLEAQAPLRPQGKLEAIRRWQAQGLVVVKVGDGVNDAPALAAADVGMAMGGGADIALETADCALLRGRVGDVGQAVELARRTMRVIRQNVAVALGLKGLFLVTTLVGLTGLWPAVLADTGATVLVTLNALRLLHLKRE